MALPVTEYLNATIIIQLSIKLPLLAAWRFFCLSKRSIKKKTPDDAGPAGSPVLLASDGTPKTRLASYSATSSAARRHQTGAANMRVPVSGRRFPEQPQKHNFGPQA